ncbi:hypothetical protein OROMI_012580 [Orobanche minor]
MPTSQTSSLSVKKKESIIDGRIFTKSMVMERINLKGKDDIGMEMVVSRLKQQGLYRLASHHADLYDEQIMEEFYFDVSFKYSYQRRGGDIFDIMVTVQGIEISLNRELLEDIYRLPSNSLKMEELEMLGYAYPKVLIYARQLQSMQNNQGAVICQIAKQSSLYPYSTAFSKKLTAQLPTAREIQYSRYSKEVV